MFKKISKDENISNISLKIRLYPTESQKILIEKTFGCCRKIFNERLQERNEFYIEHKLELKGKTKEEKEKINPQQPLKGLTTVRFTALICQAACGN